jgi:RNA polymerase-associated protein CTR9
MATEILIPVQNTDKYLSIPLAELPQDPTEIIEILTNESAPLKFWLECAVGYYKKGNAEAFKTILGRFQDSAPPDKIKEDKSTLIAILNALATYYTKLSRITTDKVKSVEYHRQASFLYNKADKIDVNEEITWVGKGISQLFLRKRTADSLERADKQFQTVLEQNPNNIPALLGKACILFKKGKYQETLEKYKQVITLNPGCPASVRLGIANCYHKLNRNDLAKLALQRCIDLEPDNETRADALVNLAILEWNEGNVDKAQPLVKEAYRYDTSNSKVLNLLSNLFFQKGDYDMTQALAMKGLHGTVVQKIQAESSYYLARLYHTKKIYHQADTYYQQATQLWPEFILPQFGLGQMCLQRQDTDKAIKCFEKVLDKAPDNYETLKILGALYAEKGKTEKALTYLKRAMAMQPYDIETCLELVQILETTDFAAALKVYEKVIETLTKTDDKIPTEIWNNIGVLHHQLKNYAESERYYRKALTGDFDQEEYKETVENANSKPEDDAKRMRWKIDPSNPHLYSPANVTITFNLARLYEDEQKLKIATILYQQILKEYPSYVDCLMRLGSMSRASGEIFAASEWFKEVIAINPERNHESWTLLANLHLDKQEWNPAQKKYEVVMKNNRNDPYVNLQIANIFLSTSKLYPTKKAKYIKIAQNYFLSVLTNDPHNIYAANGLAIVFKEQGLIDEAKDFFMQVREATSNIPDVWINLAHINLLQRQYENAIRLYQSCLRDFYGNSDPNVLLYLAKAYFEDGRLEECKVTLQKAIRLTPWNADLWYNLALALKENAIKLSNINTTNAQKMGKAITDYQAAIPIFEKLATPDPSTRRGYSTTKCVDFQRSSTANLQMAYDKQKELKEKEEFHNQMIEEKRLKAEKIVQERMRKKEEEEFQKQARQLELEAEAEEIAARIPELVNAWNADKPKARKKATRRKRKADELGLGSDNEGEEVPAPEGGASPTTITNSIEHLKKARRKSGNKRKKSEEETPEKNKRKRLSKKKDIEEEEERGEDLGIELGEGEGEGEVEGEVGEEVMVYDDGAEE